MLAKTRKRFEKLENDVRVIGTNLGRLMIEQEESSAPSCWVEWVYGEPVPPESLIGRQVRVHLESAAKRGCAALNVPGTLVRYTLGRCWNGMVIPTPPYSRTHGNTGEQLVYVQRGRDGAIRGCYGKNLVRL